MTDAERKELENLAKLFIIDYEPLTEEERDLIDKREQMSQRIKKLQDEIKTCERIIQGIERRMDHILYNPRP